MKSANQPYEQFADLQRMSLQPMREFSSIAVQAFERIARKNYDVIGDVIEFTAGQVQVPVSGASPQDIVEQQSANVRAFAEKVSSRTHEYLDLAEELSELMSSAGEEVAEAARDQAKLVAGSSAQRVADVVEKASEGAAKPTRKAPRKAAAEVKSGSSAPRPSSTSGKKKAAGSTSTPAKAAGKKAAGGKKPAAASKRTPSRGKTA